MLKDSLHPMEHDILVDGYNVIRHNEMFRAMEIKSSAEARKLLIKQLHNRYRHQPCRVTVVFDGNGAREQVSHQEHIRVIFSCSGETADGVIARLAAEARAAGHKVEMYSNDNEVRQAVVEQGGQARSVHQLVTNLTSAPSDVAYRAYYRQEMRRTYGIDPWYKPEDDLDPSPVRGKKRKKKKSLRRH
jgi:predicted RNA-binding protein with PIN domain